MICYLIGAFMVVQILIDLCIMKSIHHLIKAVELLNEQPATNGDPIVEQKQHRTMWD